MRATSIKLSVFTAFTIIVTYWLAAVIGNFSLFADTYSVKALFTDATGILNGDLVKIAGVDVGKVTGFEVENGLAVVSMEIEGEVELPENVIVDIKFRNLLGQRLINLVRPQDPSEEPLEPDAVIPVTQTRSALDLSVVFNNLRPLIQTTNPEDINAVAEAVLEVFEGREKQFAETLGNIGSLTQTLADRDQRLARLVTDLDDLTAVLNRQSGSISQGLSRFTEFMESLAEVTPRIERVVDQLEGASTKFGGLLERNRANLDQELDDLAVLLQIIEDNLGPLDRVAKNLKEVLLATARSQGYGKWWNLYVVNFCLEQAPNAPAPLGCER
ncbi:MAG: MlaD family protein [Actinomycetota bacterium]